MESPVSLEAACPLRLTLMAESRTAVTLKVEGRVLGGSSSVLEAECLYHLASGRRVLLDFAGVMCVDSRGVAVLRGLKARNVELINCWSLIAEQIASGDDA